MQMQKIRVVVILVQCYFSVKCVIMANMFTFLPAGDRTLGFPAGTKADHLNPTK